MNQWVSILATANSPAPNMPASPFGSLAIFHALDDPRSEAQALNNLALICSAQKNYDKAIERDQTY